MKYAVLFIPSGNYLCTLKGLAFPLCALYSEEEEEKSNIEILFFSSKEEALQIFNKKIWDAHFAGFIGEPDYILFNNQRYFTTKDTECFEIVEINE